jgi:hypothetical protein
VSNPLVVIVDVVPITRSVFVHAAVLALDSNWTVCRDVSFVLVRPFAVLRPGRRSARDGEDETSNQTFHVRSSADYRVHDVRRSGNTMWRACEPYSR